MRVCFGSSYTPDGSCNCQGGIKNFFHFFGFNDYSNGIGRLFKAVSGDQPGLLFAKNFSDMTRK